MDLLFSDLKKTVEDQRWKQKQAHDNMKETKFLQKTLLAEMKMDSSVIQQVTGPVSYQIRLEDGMGTTYSY